MNEGYSSVEFPGHHCLLVLEFLPLQTLTWHFFSLHQSSDSLRGKELVWVMGRGGFPLPFLLHFQDFQYCQLYFSCIHCPNPTLIAPREVTPVNHCWRRDETNLERDSHSTCTSAARPSTPTVLMQQRGMAALAWCSPKSIQESFARLTMAIRPSQALTHAAGTIHK